MRAKISLGFSIVLALHVSIAVLGHYGLTKSREDFEHYGDLHYQVEEFDEINRVVGALQRYVLLFAFTGYQGPEEQVGRFQDRLEELLERVARRGSSLHLASDSVGHQGRGAHRSIIEEMQEHLAVHREIFAAVVTDRAKRKRLLKEVLPGHGRAFDDGIERLGQTVPETSLAKLEAAFRSAQLKTVHFVNAPDSSHVRLAKRSLLTARSEVARFGKHESRLVRETARQLQSTLDAYEEALIQMVQTTRGYLHLVNVVLAGESEEFRRLASEARAEQAKTLAMLTAKMTSDSKRFQSASNAFSIITIVLGLVAASCIQRDIVPTLVDVTKTLDGLAQGESCDSIPGTGRCDELGRLATAAQVFKEKASETGRLLHLATMSEMQLNEANSRLEQQTALAEAMAVEANKATLAKSEFLANMSHEIRTPMTAIMGFAEKIAEENVDETTADAIETICRNGQHLLSIINDILDLSKVEAGKMTVEQIPCAPREILDNIESALRPSVLEAGLVLKIQCAENVPQYIQTDPTRLRQILLNLLGNAVKFTEFGQITLTVRHVQREGQSMLEFDVEDTGIGMEEEQASRLFHPFSQADSSTTRQFGGTGLGLTISKRFAELLGGSVELLYSTPGEGSCFRASVRGNAVAPRSPERASPPANADALHSATDLTGRRILLAEDGADNQRLLNFYLCKVGAEVEVVENGRMAMEAALAAKAAGTPYDVVLMDMQMPVMDGYHATAALREQGYVAPIVAVTAHAMAGDEAKCRDVGCDAYITKPVERQKLLTTVARAAAGQLSPSGNSTN